MGRPSRKSYVNTISVGLRKLKTSGCVDTIHSKANSRDRPLLGQNRVKCLNQEHCDAWKSQKLYSSWVTQPGIELTTFGTRLFGRHECSAVFLPCENRCRVFLPSFVKSHTKLTVLMHIGNFMSHLEGEKMASSTTFDRSLPGSMISRLILKNSSPKVKILSSFSHPHVIQSPYDFHWMLKEMLWITSMQQKHTVICQDPQRTHRSITKVVRYDLCPIFRAFRFRYKTDWTVHFTWTRYTRLDINDNQTAWFSHVRKIVAWHSTKLLSGY